VALCRRGYRAQGADVIRMGEREVLDYCAAERGAVDVGLADAELVEEQDEVRDEVVERLGQRCPSREAVPAEVVGDGSGCSGQPWNQLLEHAAIHGEGAWISTIGMPEPPVSRTRVSWSARWTMVSLGGGTPTSRDASILAWQRRIVLTARGHPTKEAAWLMMPRTSSSVALCLNAVSRYTSSWSAQSPIAVRTPRACKAQSR
jgi:hypothetical protein